MSKYVNEDTTHDSIESKKSEIDEFLDDNKKDDKERKKGSGSVRKSKRPESVREHASNYRQSVGYVQKMRHGEGPRDDTDDSDEPDSKRASVRDSYYNRKSNKEALQE